MLSILLISNWHGLRGKVVHRIVDSRHRLAGVIVRPLHDLSLRATLMTNVLARLPQGAKLARRFSSPEATEQVKLIRSVRKNRVQIHRCMDVNSSSTLAMVRDVAPDLIISLGWPRKFGDLLLELPKLGCINVHPSLLPRYRGLNPIAATILADDSETGITYHQMNSEYDQGDILHQTKVKVDSRETGLTLLAKLGRAVIDTLISFLDDFDRDELNPQPQRAEDGCDAPTLAQTDAKVNWAASSRLIDRKVRAFHPWFKSYTFHKQRRITFSECTPDKRRKESKPGQVLEIVENGLWVATGDGSLLLTSPEIEGQPQNALNDFGRRGLQVEDVLT